MRIRLAPLSLGWRIVGSVALGLAITLVLFGLVVLWTIHESTDAAYRERVTLAETLGTRVDDVLRYGQETLEREAAQLSIEPGRPLDYAQRRRLADVHFQMGSFATLSVSDASGHAVWEDPVTPETDGGDLLRHPSVGLALGTGKTWITELPATSEHGTSFACIAVPLRNSDGAIVGTLMAEVDPRHPALNLLPTSAVGNGILVQLMNASGQILAGTEGFSAAAGLEHSRLLGDLIGAHRSGYQVHEAPPQGGFASHIVAYAPVVMLPGWGVVVEQPQDAVLALPNQLQERLALFGLIALLIAAAAAWLDVRRLVRPLNHLTEAAERFAGGDLDQPVRVERRDEVGILARAFDTMRQRLRASLAEVAEWNRELEHRVVARTTELEQRNRELGHLNEIAVALSGSWDVRSMLERTLDHMLQITDAEAGCFWMTGDDGVLRLGAERHAPPSLWSDHVPTDDCLCDRAMRQRTVVAMDAEGKDVCCRVGGCAAAIAVPVPAGERVQGLLFLASSHAGRFRYAELATLGAIGRQVGIALSNARLYQSLEARDRERAELLQRLINSQEDERRRLAQELHDETSQALASLQLGLERLAAGTGETERSRQLAGQLQGVAAQTLAAVHRLAVELRPSILDDIGLVAAIERFLQECGERWSMEIDFAVVGAESFRLIPAAETTVYRIVQAALTNVANHAQARRVSVLLEQRDRNLVVVVEDDGRGFVLEMVRAAPLETRLGLAGMEERASLIGATLTVETAPGAGTTIFLEVPLDTNCRREDGDVEVAHLVS